jgi:hypothetical protein
VAPAGTYAEALAAWTSLDGLRLPDRPYARADVLAYLAHGREKGRTAILSMTDAEAKAPCGFPGLGLSRAELLLYNLRHVQHHAAQLNLLLRQAGVDAPSWCAARRRSARKSARPPRRVARVRGRRREPGTRTPRLACGTLREAGAWRWREPSA